MRVPVIPSVSQVLHQPGRGPVVAGDAHEVGVDGCTLLDEPGGRVDVQGLSLPGLPAIIVGGNGHVAWGFTNSYGDYLDWKRERPCGSAANTGCARVARHRERIAVAGGGPAGLYFALLMKRDWPALDITVIERNRADDTFGFGVVFSDATLRKIEAADSVLTDGLAEHGKRWEAIDVVAKGETRSFGGNGRPAISVGADTTAPTVSGSAPDIARWLSGRGARRLASSTGDLPEIPRWF